MNEITLTVIFLCTLFFLLGSGVWVALSLMGVAWLGMELFSSRPVGDAMFLAVWSSSSSWTLTALPLFIWMAEILCRTDLSENMFKGIAPWLTKIPGKMLHTNIIGSAIFAAVSGSSAATLTTVGKMSIPELLRRGYPQKMVYGTITGAATLGLMIPPSLTLIVYGVSINESISKLFIAGILPGIVLAILFMSYIVVWSLLNKNKIPKDSEKLSFVQKIKQSSTLIPLIILIMFIMGSMYMGFATATESAAIGVLGALIMAAFQKSLTFKIFFESLLSSARISCMIAFILMGAAFLSQAMGFSGIPRAIAEVITSWGLSNFALILVLMLFYIVIGCFLDGISAVVLTMSVIEPLIRHAGIDVIWFGIFIVLVVEMAQITPPVGFNLFVMQGLTKKPMSYIAYSAIPMFLIMILMVIIIYVFPELATYLPEKM